MPRGGHNAKTTEEHIAHGTYRRDRHSKRLTVPPVNTIPEPPAEFDKEHSAAWFEFCDLLHQKGILTAADVYAVQTFVEAKITARRTYATMLKEGFTIDGRKNPLHMVYSEAVKTMRALYTQFGLTPLARTQLKLTDSAGERPDPMADLLASINR